ITTIINNNEPFASNFGECQGTPAFALAPPDEMLLNVAWFKVYAGDAAAAKPIPAASFTAKRGVNTADCSEGGQCVGWIKQGDWIAFNDLDFGKGSSVCEARVASATQGGLIELRLDAPNGPLFGVMEVPTTGDWQSWVTRKVEFPLKSGKHKLVMAFKSRPVSVTPQDLAGNSEFVKAIEQYLRCRIAGAKDHLELNHRFPSWEWRDLPGPMESWARSFVNRVTDISSLGNVMSTQDRFVQQNYLLKERELRDHMTFQPPANVTARGTLDGAVITWENRHASARGFHVYRDGKRVDSQPLPPTATSFQDRASGSLSYAVTAVDSQDHESPLSVPARCEAGAADKTAPRLVVISPPTSAVEGQAVWLKARALDNRSYDLIAVTLHYRKPGAKEFSSLVMARRSKAIFTAAIPWKDVTAAGLVYFFTTTDGDNAGFYPPSAPASLFSLVTTPGQLGSPPPAPSCLAAKQTELFWKPSARGDVVWYRIYRSQSPNFTAGPETWLTYVAADTTRFAGNGLGLQGRPLGGAWYYRVSAVDRIGRESRASASARVDWPL
ncbi:MAG: carbohydrate-binding protein, partial [Planctomycetota bacterium]|nr:carbohydrate-binding protein [Planctomycetota bacterium]